MHYPLPANTEEWKRFDRIFEENVLELGFDEQKNEIYLVYMMTDAIESILLYWQVVRLLHTYLCFLS